MTHPTSWGRVAVDFGPNCVVGPNAQIGLYREAAARGHAAPLGPVTFGRECAVGANVVIHEGTRFGSGVFIDDNSRIGYGCEVGDHARFEYGVTVSDRVRIGAQSVIAGFLGDAVEVGIRCIVMGHLVHELSRPISSEWGIEEPAPRIENEAVVGMGAVVVGGIVVGERAYVAAGAIVTRSVPANHIAVGINRFVPRSDWRGGRLEMIPPGESAV